ncbi:MAG: hypothetical protein NTW03_14450, partial [Verrucomicrobia bacterium]|nr:hypothetical protein [Verrucomicrobiota bacterium]
AYYNGDAQIDPGLSIAHDPNGLSLYDFLVGSFDPNGAPRWIRGGVNVVGNNHDQEPRGLAVDAAGNVYVTGFLEGTSLSADSGKSVWLTHFNASGGTMWTEQGRGDNGQFNSGRGVAMDPAGCIYLTGSFTDPSLSFDAFNPVHIPLAAPSGAEEIFLTKYCPLCECIPVSIVTQPSDQWTSTGLPVTFTVTASGTPPFTFGWYRNGVLITGNSPCWTINTVTTASGLTSTLTLTCFPAGWSYADTFSAGVANLWCFDTVVQSTGVQIIRFKIVGGWESYTNRFRLDITAPAGVAYDVQYRNDLNPSTAWQVLTNGVGTGSNAPVVDPSPPPSMRYYRLRLR